MKAIVPSDEDITRFRSLLVEWFEGEAREFRWRGSRSTNYERIIAEVLLQRTTATAVAKVFDSFIEAYPTWEALAAAQEAALEERLRPLGLWRRKAAVLLALARAMLKRAGAPPAERDELEQLPGVGQYIASAVLLTAFGQPEPLLDTNMARVLERYFGPREKADIRYDPYLQDLSRRVVRGPFPPTVVNWAVLDFGALVCRPRSPRCSECPLLERCRFGQMA